MPARDALPLFMMVMLEALNIRSILASMSCSALEPIDRMTTSAATPMMMPRLMKKLLSL